MTETFTPFSPESLTEELMQTRLLTEVDHLVRAYEEHGCYPEPVLADVGQNLDAAVQEISMPYAVTETFHPAEERVGEEGRYRVFTFLGKCAVQVARTGEGYLFSEQGWARMDLETDEARHNQATLRPGFAQAFISPKMSEFDAPAHVAEAEHLARDDSLRVSTCRTDEHGNVLGRDMKSLHVRDIPLSAWVAMCKDPNSLFGKALPVGEERSALSIMKLFKHMELPESALLEGPVTLVEAVLPYIQDPVAQASVAIQLDRFRGNQTIYHEQARATRTEWLAFEIELAESVRLERATYQVKRFIASLQGSWSDENLSVILDHQLPGNEYKITREFLAVLEKAKQNLLASMAGLATGNEDVIFQAGAKRAQELQADIAFLNHVRYQAQFDASLQESVQQLEAAVWRKVAGQNFSVGGGCPGQNEDNFQKDSDANLKAPAKKDLKSEQKKWKKRRGECVVSSCPTRPDKVELGPCGVCMGRCQEIFNKGGDPTKGISLKSVIPQPSQKPEAEARKTTSPTYEEKRLQLLEQLQQEVGGIKFQAYELPLRRHASPRLARMALAGTA